ncbi:MAG TPA: cytochrome ubiquinol oxidase subunit I [Candidatus Rikenella faecigallinarum]|uniref:Cytochrome ubiquinol oxidase subunit I n=1 Tax=Candidatus Rikenella faecigallinarum TaxID=2838745 RepID=A0A9D1TZF9_9BACT|nr:cytochrome ubiquinol oxidase subunit I [Candidatus Rikenella faecigallinarum]
MNLLAADLGAVVDWSRAQFALTAIYHWLFVPLTLGLGFIIAFMETRYVRTGDEFWKRTTKFWMRLFGINFAIGVATGLILEFEFGTNWSNYSYFVGDIFGAPLAIEGIMAFFMESTFIAVMFFGWDKVSKKFHLAATWLTAIGANLSALWILVANAWMQYPAGMRFNPETARNEMVNFWDVLFSPVAMNKFFHTVTSAFVLAAVFVIGVSAWYLLRKREERLARKSIKIASIFGLIGAVCVIWTGDGSAVQVAKYQPMKLATMENLQEGQTHAPLSLVPGVEIPSMLSVLAYHDTEAYVVGINDLIEGNPEQGILSADEKIKRGQHAIETLAAFKAAQKTGDTAAADSIAQLFDPATEAGKTFHNDYFRYFGYGYLQSAQETLPPFIPLIYWSFRVMVGLGIWFVVLFIWMLILEKRNTLGQKRLPLHLALWSIPLVYIASQAGWVVAEVGRQPWTIQDLLPTVAAVSRLESASVQVTFWIFAALFTTLLIAEIGIMVKQIRRGPSDK